MSLVERRPSVPIRWLAIWAGVALAVLLIVVWATGPRKKTGGLKTVSPVSAILASPESYENFSGLVKKSGNPMVVEMPFTDNNGNDTTRTYTVAVGPKTVVEAMNLKKNRETKTITPSQIVAESLVQVYSDSDVATVREFTATKIYRLDQ